MAAQTKVTGLAKRLGAQIAQAHAEHRDKPVELGRPRLPKGINGGTFQLRVMEFAEHKEGDHKGKLYFRAAGVVVEPKECGGQSVEGLQTSQIIPMHDTPERKNDKLFKDHWATYLNIFKMFNVDMPPQLLPNESQTQAAERIEMYFQAAAEALCKQQPYAKFSTRGWTPPATPLKPKPDEMIFEEWQGTCEYHGGDPALNGMADHGAAPDTQTQTNMGAAPPPTNGQQPQHQPGGDGLPEDLPSLLALATAELDPSKATEQGKAAQNALEAQAIALGLTPEDFAPMSWDDVAAFIQSAQGGSTDPVVGAIYKFTRRDGKGGPLLNPKNKQPFPPIEVELVSVDVASQSCTAKTKDGKPVNDVTGKKVLAIKWEWLE